MDHCADFLYPSKNYYLKNQLNMYVLDISERSFDPLKPKSLLKIIKSQIYSKSNEYFVMKWLFLTLNPKCIINIYIFF